MASGVMEIYTTTVARARAAVEAVSDDQLGRPTPCSEWNVQQLLDHMAGAQTGIAGMVIGGEVAAEGSTMAKIDAAASAIAKAAAEPGALEKVVQSRMGEMPVARMIGLAVGDLSVHTWDLAKATGQDTALDGAVVDFLHPIMEGMSKRGPSPAFAPPVSVPDDAPLQDRLIGLTGRAP